MAKPDADADAAKQDPAADKGGGMMKMLMLGVGMFIVVTASNILAPFITTPLMAKYAPPPEEIAEDAAEVIPDPIYHSLNPPMIVNFSGNSAAFLQVAIDVVARDQKIIDAVKTHDAAIRNALLMLFAGQTKDTISTREGKQMLRKEVLTEIQKVLEPYVGAPNVEEIFFTSFVAQ